MCGVPALLAGMVVLWAMVGVARSADVPELVRASHRRRPAAMAWIEPGRLLAVANARSGTLCVLTVPAAAEGRGRDWDLSAVREFAVSRSLTDLTRCGPGRLLAIDGQNCQVMTLRWDGQRIALEGKSYVPGTPMRVEFDSVRSEAWIASRFGHCLQRIDLADLRNPRVKDTVELDFAPNDLLLLPDGRLLVADAFGGRLALVRVEDSTVVRRHRLANTHNIRGMRLDPAGSAVLMAHQMLNPEQATTAANVHWGDVMSNVVRRLDVAQLDRDRLEATTAADLYYLGRPDRATGDPTGILCTGDGRQIVGFAGIGQVGVSDRGANYFRRVAVGARPVAMIATPDEERLFVANWLDDSISMVDIRSARLLHTVLLGETPPRTRVDEGERLFYDARLSSDGWFSCHSCHTDGHSNGQLADTFGDGYRGSPKRVLSLLGAADTGPYGWRGTVPTLARQIRKSIITTMRGPIPEEQVVQSLAAYVRSLPPAPGVDSARGRSDELSVARGGELFRRHDCTSCHTPPAYTSAERYEISLTSGSDRLFNPPSLRGVSQRREMLHDGSAGSYREVLARHPSSEPLLLEDPEWVDLTKFLDSL